MVDKNSSALVRHLQAGGDGRASQVDLEGKQTSMPTRKNYNAWGRKVDELMARRGMTLKDVADRMEERGYPVKHPKHALNRAMQKHHHKAITPRLTVIVRLVLDATPEEADELWLAHQQTGYESLEEEMSQDMPQEAPQNGNGDGPPEETSPA